MIKSSRIGLLVILSQIYRKFGLRRLGNNSTARDINIKEVRS
ncbi:MULTISPECIES: hypothetical protein [unclassified Microcystis]|nr:MULTISPECIES: hypothetical protein [unclassified Microcystis]